MATSRRNSSLISEETRQLLSKELTEFEKRKISGEDTTPTTTYLKELAEKYAHKSVTFGVCKHLYYTYIKGSIDTLASDSEPDVNVFDILAETESEVENTPKEETKVIDIDSSIENFLKETTPPTSTKKKYLPGQKVTVKVNSIRSYGVLVETVEDQTQGLIHISEVKKHFIEDLSIYFEEGDIVEDVKIIKVEKDGRLALSTLDTKLPMKNLAKEEVEVPKNNLLAEKLSVFKDRIQEQAPPSEPDNELKQIMDFIRGIVGAISPQAEELLKELKNESDSMFLLSKAIMEVERDFQPDLSLMFMLEVQKRMDGGL